MGKKGSPECEAVVGRLNDRGGGRHLLNVKGNIVNADGYLAGCANMKLTQRGNNAYFDKDGVLKARGTINAGDEIFIDYGSGYKKLLRERLSHAHGHRARNGRGRAPAAGTSQACVYFKFT